MSWSLYVFAEDCYTHLRSASSAMKFGQRRFRLLGKDGHTSKLKIPGSFHRGFAVSIKAENTNELLFIVKASTSLFQYPHHLHSYTTRAEHLLSSTCYPSCALITASRRLCVLQNTRLTKVHSSIVIMSISSVSNSPIAETSIVLSLIHI